MKLPRIAICSFENLKHGAIFRYKKNWYKKTASGNIPCDIKGVIGCVGENKVIIIPHFHLTASFWTFDNIRNDFNVIEDIRIVCDE